MNDEQTILLVQNNKDFIYALEQAFRAAKIATPLRVARYGNEAILLLKGVGVYSDRKLYPLPTLIVLDLTIPDGTGLLVLGWVRAQPALEHIPVIVLVDGPRCSDLQRALDMGANAYSDRYSNLSHLILLIEDLEIFSPLSKPKAHIEAVE